MYIGLFMFAMQFLILYEDVSETNFFIRYSGIICSSFLVLGCFWELYLRPLFKKWDKK